MKGGQTSPDTEDTLKRVDTGVEGSKNAQTLPAAPTLRRTCMGLIRNTDEIWNERLGRQKPHWYEYN